MPVVLDEWIDFKQERKITEFENDAAVRKSRSTSLSIASR
jgi:hypothetical protein